MPSRSSNKPAVQQESGNNKPGIVQSSPLKIETHKFLKVINLFDRLKEESERLSKVGDEKVPTLYLTFDSDEVAHRVALGFLQQGDEFGGVTNELVVYGFPKNEPEDDLICMFQFVPRSSEGMPLEDKVPTKLVTSLIAEVGKIKYTTEEIAGDGKTAPKCLVAIFEKEEDAARVAWHYISTDTKHDESPLDCVGDKDEPLTLAFFAVATA